MAFPAAPTESGGDKFVFLTSDSNAACGWVAVETGTTGTGANTVGWAGVATHVEGDEVADPGDITTGGAPVVLAAGDDGTNAVPLQLSGSDLKITLDSEAVVLGAGTAAFGKLAANTGVDIGDVDVLTCGTITPGTAASNLGKAEDAGHSTGDVGVMALAVRDDNLAAFSGAEGDYEPFHTDSSGRLHVVDQNSSDIKTAVELIDNAVDGNYLNVNANIAGTDFVGGAGAVAAGVQRTTLASDDPAVAKLGTIDTDTGAMVTALQLLDNAVDGNYLNTNMNIAGTDVVGGGGTEAAALRVTIANDSTGVVSVDDNGGALSIDDGGNSITVDGNTGDNGPGFTTIYKYLAKSTTADATLWDPSAGKKVVVTDVIISISGTATDVNLAFGAGTTLTTQFLKFHGDVRGGLTHHFRSPIKGGTDENLNIDLSAAQAMTITVCGYEE